MAGKKFKKGLRQFRLVFPEGDELHGLEVLMKSMSIQSFLSMTDKFALAADDTAKTLGIQRSMFKFFASNLVEWNLTDEKDQDVPPVLAQCVSSGLFTDDDGYCPQHAPPLEQCEITGILGQEIDFIMSLYKAWQEAMAGVDAPLPAGSQSGGPSPVASIPMDVS